jgi:hypothetical protein
MKFLKARTPGSPPCRRTGRKGKLGRAEGLRYICCVKLNRHVCTWVLSLALVIGLLMSHEID